jgi:hypothetical protein
MNASNRRVEREREREREPLQLLLNEAVNLNWKDLMLVWLLNEEKGI